MKKNQRGSTSVFLLLILATMLSLVGAFIHAAKEDALKSYGDGLLDIASDSVLSEFDLDLKDSYGLLGFYGTGSEVETKMRYYVDYSLDMKRHASLKELSANTGGHSLGSADILEAEILDYMKFAMAENLLKKGKEKQNETLIAKDRVLRNQRVLKQLPSAGLEGEGESFFERAKRIGETLTSIEDVFQKNAETYLLNQYILFHFKNAADPHGEMETFFTNEVEYILAGEHSNKKNLEEVKSSLVALRSGLNVSYLYADPQKRAATLAMAELMTPGPGAVLTQAVIVGTWAYAEARNDAALLEAGKKVPIVKDDESWATDLDAVMNNTEKPYIEPSVNKGLSYEQYLMVFLHFQNKSVKLARVMDLIQINMQGNYNGDFMMKEYNIGFQYRGKMNTNEYNCKVQY